MNVYLQNEVVFKDKGDAIDFIARLPSFALAQLNVVKMSSFDIYQVIVYCFDDEVNVNDYL